MDKSKILFLCTGNSARSIMAEYILRKKDPIRFEVYSAGSDPKDHPHPLALNTLRETFQIDATDAQSKSWEIFKEVSFDFVITVCDHAREACPVWPGQPIIAHWGSLDPAHADGDEDERKRVFKEVGLQIARRIDLFLNLPIERIKDLRVDLEKATQEIGQTE